MTLSACCPIEWNTVSNGIDTRYENAAKEGQRVLEKFDCQWFLDFYEDPTRVAAYEFEQTPRISTYLYAICSGPYSYFEDYDPMYPPQRCFVRKSLISNLRYKLIFGISKTTIDFYQKNFGHRYPFSKVDHVMCPDYKYGAMENVGCITYSDDIMCSSPHMSIPQLTFFCVVIQHELAHMWFGNLVTMKWWNGLWLNEAFATALSYYACAQGGEFVEEFKNESWLHFANYKRWGLNDDLAPTNHCIEAPCKDTGVCEGLIDGITYGKGASMLQQLIFLMGWEAFSAGLKLYFQQFKWTNTSLTDFIGKLQEGYDKTIKNGDLNLVKWAEQWLSTKGPNKITYEFTHDEGIITSFKIRQGFCKYGDEVYRKQSINIGFFAEDHSFTEFQNIVIEDRELTEVPQLVGQQVPEAILMNSSDNGFGVFVIDEKSIRYFEQHLSKIEKQVDKAVVIG